MILCVHMVLSVFCRVASRKINPESKTNPWKSNPELIFCSDDFLFEPFFFSQQTFSRISFFLEFPLQFHFSQISVFRRIRQFGSVSQKKRENSTSSRSRGDYIGHDSSSTNHTGQPHLPGMSVTSTVTRSSRKSRSHVLVNIRK